ncbi:CHY zinc finger protein [Halosimplex sp. TS25]|uniref:CHY zinc finger protein n=1 Tax=Halosimplex rarum TaxID=3396619 RepID=UPI0039EA507F
MPDEPESERQTTAPPETDRRFPVPLRGVDVDSETRCTHYESAVDVVALRFPCCDCYYPCFRCHDEVTDHDPERVTPEAFADPAVLCGACGETPSVHAYLDCDDTCHDCGAAFNPGCRRHRDRYFAVER